MARSIQLTAVLATAATAASLLTDGVRAEVVYGQYSSTTSYAYKIIHMPDFDQRRAESADGSIPGLPNNGSMYCVPTSSMNVCAYIATHGFPTVPPQDYPWTNPSSYDVATGSDFILGLLMGTSATGGTGGDGWYNGIRAWVPLDQFTVSAFYADNAWWPRRWDMAQNACTGGLISFCWGWYDIIGEIFGLPIVDRAGGHCVTLTQCVGGSTNAWVAVRDPADDAANTTQSPFMDRMYWSETRSIYTNGQIRTVDNLDSSQGNPVRRILDGYCAVRPKAGVTFDEPAQEFSWQLAGDLLGSLQPLFGSLPVEAPVQDFVVGLHQNNLYAIVDIGGGVHLLQCYPFGGADPAVLDFAFEDVEGIALGTHHRLYVASGHQLHMVDIGDGFMSYQWALDMSGPAGAMAYDDTNDQVLVYNTENFHVLSYEWHGDGEVIWHPVPDAIAAGVEGRDMTWDPTRNAVWMISDYQPVAYMIPLDGGPFVAVDLPGVGEATSIDVDDQGHLFVSDCLTLREYREDAELGWVQHDGPLTGMHVGSSFRVTKSRTNFDPSQHVEGWHNVLPEEDFGIPMPDCQGDVNGDGTVDFADILEVLSTYGPCTLEADCSGDLDDDDVVGFSDVLEVLSFWGPCPG